MEYVELGSTGTRVSQLCLGTWRFGKETDGTVETTREEAHELLDAAWERGVNFIDTANVYGKGDSERYIGEWLDDHDREDFVIASKVLWATRGTSVGGIGEYLDDDRDVLRKGLSRKSIRAEIDATLDRLGTDYLDVYYIHTWDEETPIEETLSTLNDLVREGTVHYLAASNAAAWQMAKALWKSDVEGWERFELVQPKFNAAHREETEELRELCADRGLAICPYSPLEGGFLTGKYDRDGGAPEGSRGELQSWDDRFSERQWRVLDEIRAVADEVDATPAQVSLRWLMDSEPVPTVPIVGARSVDQLDENVGAVECSLSDRHRERITDAYAGEDGDRT